MKKLIMTKGLPASGKTTWAKSQHEKRINKDDLRAMIDDGKWSKGNEKLILEARDLLVHLYLREHSFVIVDDTNLAPKHEAHLKEIAELHGAEFSVKDFTNVPLAECIERDRKRANSVGSKVIMRMYNQFLKPEVPVIEYNPKLQDCIICDLDGTLSLFPGKNPYERDFENDILNKPVHAVIDKFTQHSTDTQLIFFSGRNGKFQRQTNVFLGKNKIFNYKLYMREEYDTRKDWVVKREMYEQNVEGKYNVLFVIDDRDQVVHLWRSLGLTCFQVAEGDF